MDTLKDWLFAFWKIISRPSAGTFCELAERAEDKLGSSIAWATSTGILVLVSIYSLYRDSFRPLELITDIIYGIIAFPLLLLVWVFCVRLVAVKVFGQEQISYDALLFAFTSIFVVWWTALIVISLVPVGIIEILTGIVYFYGLFLAVIAVKAIARLRLWQAIITVVLGTLLSGVGWGCLLYFVLSLINTVPKVF